MEVLFPFGHGLSYTTFSVSRLRTDKDRIKESESLTVSVDVTNTGNRAGKELAQLYVAPKGGTVIRPVRELKCTVYVESETVIPKVYTMNSSLGGIFADPEAKAVFENAMSQMSEGTGTFLGAESSQQGAEAISGEMIAAMMEGMPLRQMLSFMPGMTKEGLKTVLSELNQQQVLI